MGPSIASAACLGITICLGLACANSETEQRRLTYDQYLDWCRIEAIDVYGIGTAEDVRPVLNEALDTNREIIAPEPFHDYHSLRAAMLAYMLRTAHAMDDDDHFTAAAVELQGDGHGAAELLTLMSRVLISYVYYDLVSEGCIEDIAQ